MKHLQLVKTEPGESTRKLMEALAQGKEVTRFNLYEDQDYDRLLALIFSHDEVVSWW